MLKPVTIITEPTRASKRFEDNVTVIRIFNPDEQKMVAALKKILSLPQKMTQKEKGICECELMPALSSEK